MRICYIVSEYFRWGQYGGYGTITRAVAEGLANRGHEVYALVPKRTIEAQRDQRDLELINGVTVVGLPPSYTGRLRRRWLYSLPQPDLYVSIDARFDSWMAMKTNQYAHHCIWFVDPMDFDTYWRQHRSDPDHTKPFERWVVRMVFETLRRFGHSAVRRADELLAQAEYLTASAREFYRINRTIHFAPNPIRLPAEPIFKSDKPLVLFLGRMDWQKRPEMFFSLVSRFPEVDFVAAGVSSDPDRDRTLRRKYGDLPNLRMPGIVQGAEKDALLRSAWILCNTSRREGLPMSFQEALSYGCCLLSSVDPDGLTSAFGLHVPDLSFDSGLRHLLRKNAWAPLGHAGRDYIAKVNGTEAALNTHESHYQRILERSR